MTDLVGNPEDRLSCVTAHICVVAYKAPLFNHTTNRSHANFKTEISDAKGIEMNTARFFSKIFSLNICIKKVQVGNDQEMA